MPGWGGGLIAAVTLCVVISAGIAYYFHRRTKVEVETLVEEYRSLAEADEGGVPRAAPAVRPPQAPRSALMQRIDAIVSAVLAPPPSSSSAWTSSAAYEETK